MPATKYILVNDSGDYVGIFNLRHRLRMILVTALAEYGIKEAYLSVNKDNPASLAVQRHLGARIDHDNDAEYFTRIRITEPGAMPEPCRDPGKDGACG